MWWSPNVLDMNDSFLCLSIFKICFSLAFAWWSIVADWRPTLTTAGRRCNGAIRCSWALSICHGPSIFKNTGLTTNYHMSQLSSDPHEFGAKWIILHLTECNKCGSACSCAREKKAIIENMFANIMCLQHLGIFTHSTQHNSLLDSLSLKFQLILTDTSPNNEYFRHFCWKNSE